LFLQCSTDGGYLKPHSVLQFVVVWIVW